VRSWGSALLYLRFHPDEGIFMLRLNPRILCLLLLAISLSFFCLGEEPLVTDIVIEGLSTVKKEAVLKVMSTKIGSPSSQEMRREDLKAIYRLGYFSEDIRFYQEPGAGGVKIIISLKENPVIEDLIIIGNREYKSGKILARLPFKTGDILPTSAEILARMEIGKLYSAGGFKNTKINLRSDETKKGKTLVTLQIDEGKKILIKDLIFQGNDHYSAFRLRFLLDNKGSWAFFKNYYDDSSFDDDLKILRQFYMNRGYLDVAAKRGKPEYNEEKGWIQPVIIIEEGPRYTVKDIIPRNIALFTQEEVIQCFARMKGNYFDVHDYQKGMGRLQRLYGDEGYVQMEVKTDFERLSGESAVNIILDIREGSRIYVGRIKVRRQEYARDKPENFFEKMYDKISPPLKDEVILREVTLKPKDVYRTFQEVRTVERLKRLEVFESVSITREPTAEENVRDVVVNVKEGVTGNIIFSVGYGESAGPYFQARFRERNMFGEARDFRARALIGTRLTAIYLGYLDRYFLESDVSMDWELYRERYLRDEYGERIYGSAVELGKPLSEYVRGYLRFRLEHVNFFDEDEDIRSTLDSYPVATVRLRVFEDRRDDDWWPTRGFARSAALETGYADGPLVKFTTDHSYYLSVYKDLIYGARFYGGLIPYNSREIGITERFFLGGASDLRGFKYRGVGPKDAGEENMPIGGSTKLLLQNELRFPIYRDLKGVLFGDVGMLDETVHLDTPRASVGTGLRLKISIIRLSLDFAKAVYKEDTDDTRFIHFRLGADF